MKVQSTGLGKTIMVAHIEELFYTEFEDKEVLQMTIEATEPVHWTIKCYMEPSDVKYLMKLGLKFSILWKVLKSLFKK